MRSLWRLMARLFFCRSSGGVFVWARWTRDCILQHTHIICDYAKHAMYMWLGYVVVVFFLLFGHSTTTTIKSLFSSKLIFCLWTCYAFSTRMVAVGRARTQVVLAIYSIVSSTRGATAFLALYLNPHMCIHKLYICKRKAATQISSVQRSLCCVSRSLSY